MAAAAAAAAAEKKKKNGSNPGPFYRFSCEGKLRTGPPGGRMETKDGATSGGKKKTFLLTIIIKSANLEHVGWIGDRARQATGQHGASDVLHVRVFAA